VKTKDAREACLYHSKFFGEINNQSYYYYVSDLIINLFVKRQIKSPAYIRLNILVKQRKPYFETLKNITYPDLNEFQNLKYFKTIQDTYSAGLKIEYKSKIKLSIGYYKDETFQGVLCLSSNSLANPNAICKDQEIVENCTFTYLKDYNEVTESIDCYELGKQ